MNDFKYRTLDGLPGDPRLQRFPWGAPATFLGVPPDYTAFNHAEFVILPVPYEATVTYMPGTRFGPAAMIEASRYIELYDHELDCEPYRIGAWTLPELVLPATGPETALSELGSVFDVLLEEGRFITMLGGEHSVSGPPILSHVARLGERRLSVLQLDAHTDLRAEYDGTAFSHACVMHRVHDKVNLVPVGIRSLTVDERRLIHRNDIPVIFGHELESDGWIDRVLDALGPDVYITIDVDYFDPGIMPSTGTPEPGGGRWYPTLELLERVFRERNVVGCDVVELAPIPGVVAPDFLAAKLVYKLMGFRTACLREQKGT